MHQHHRDAIERWAEAAAVAYPEVSLLFGEWPQAPARLVDPWPSRIAISASRSAAYPGAYSGRMAGPSRFSVAVYAPRTMAACDAVARYLEAEGLKTSMTLPDPAPVSSLRYGVLPMASLRLSLRDGTQPSREIVEAAVQEAYRKLLAKFGEAALDLNGVLFGSIPDRD